MDQQSPSPARAAPTSLITAFRLAAEQMRDPVMLRILAKSTGVTLIVFVLLGAAFWALAAWAMTAWLPVFGESAFGEAAAALLAFLGAVIGGWLLFRIVALAVIQFFADDVVKAVERAHYGHAASVPDLPFKTELKHSANAIFRALGVNLLAAPIALFLVFTGVGTALVFWIANAFLLGRELQDLVLLRHQDAPAEITVAQNITPMSGLTRFALGGVTALLLAVPFVNFLAPILGAAAATHCIHRAKEPHAHL